LIIIFNDLNIFFSESSVPSCRLSPLVTRTFLRKRNLHLVDLKCRLSPISKNCAPASTLSFECRKGYKFVSSEGKIVKKNKNYEKNIIFIFK
jgi:hypothetical protein